MMLYIKLIINLNNADKYIQASSDGQEDNGTDINRAVYVPVYILITFQKLHNYKV